MSKQRREGIPIGILTMMLVLVILVMSTLGVLAVLTARADLGLSEKNAEYVKAYYGAEEEATANLVRVITDLIEGKGIVPNEEMIIHENTQGYTVAYNVFISERQKIAVEVSILKTNPQDYQIMNWSVVPTEFSYEDSSMQFDDVIIIED